jgi:CBS domain-containing protein
MPDEKLLTAREVMHSPVTCAAPDSPLTELEFLLVNERISGLPVVDDGHLVGVVSRSDLIRIPVFYASLCEYASEPDEYVAPAPPPEGPDHSQIASLATWIGKLKARDVMTRSVVTCAPDEDISQVAHAMTCHHVSRVFVVEDDHPVGIVSSLDLVELLAAHPQETEEEPEEVPGATTRVVIFAKPDDPRTVRDALVEVAGMQPIDAQVRVRTLPCVLPDRFTPEVAAALAARIREDGITARAVDHSEIPELSQVKYSHHVRCTDEGLEVLDSSGELVERIEWEAIKLVNVGSVPASAAQHRVIPQTTVTATARRIAHEKVEIPIRAGLEAWIVATDPIRAVRMDHNLMNYEYLGERKVGSERENFHTLIEDVIAHAPQARITPSTRAFRNKAFAAGLAFRSSDELRHNTLVHLLRD